MTDLATTAEIVPLHKETKEERARRLNRERQQRFRDKGKRVVLAPAAKKVSLPSSALKTAGDNAPVVIAAAVPFTGAAGGIRADATTVTVTPSRRFEPSVWVLRAVSVALAGVGLSMNAVYAHSLGSTDVSGWLFLALGVAADSAALVLPTVAAAAPERSQRLIGWMAFAAVFAFAILASVGFASTSISDVTALRNARVTPAVAAAQAALTDAQGARDRECKSGTGKFCREREAQVASMRQNLELAMHAVEQSADPQTSALVKIVSWTTHGTVVLGEGDVSVIRLILFALLPQIGGILLMVSRRP